MKDTGHILTTQGRAGYAQLAALTATGALAGIGVATGYEVDQLMVVSRYLMIFYAGILAFSVPWALFPQIPLYIYQSLNPSSVRLSRVLRGRLGIICLPALALFSALSLTFLAESPLDVRIWFILIENLVMVTALTLYASYRYLRVGQISQDWQEGKTGGNILKSLEQTGKSTGIPAGSVPTLTTTIIVATVGMLAVVLGAWLQGASGLWLNSAGGVLIGITGLIGWLSRRNSADVIFYQSHSFYHELFRNPGGVADGGRDPLPYAALYWVPASIRTQVWTLLRQMDRKVPVGRLVISGLVLYWAVLYSGMQDVSLIAAFPAVLITAKNVLLLRIGGPAFAPAAFQRQMGSPASWWAARFFAGFRWSFPLLGGLALATVFSSLLTAGHLWFWLSTDLVTLIVAGSYLSWQTDGKIRYQYR